MTLVASNLTSNATAGASVNGFATASVSPTANALLVLSTGGFDGTGVQDFTVSGVSGLGLTWTRQKLSVAGSTPKGDVEAWTAVCGGSPGSGAITVTLSATFSGGVAWSIDQFTGQDATTPVVAGNIVFASNSGTTSSVTYGTAASSSNLFWFMSVVLLGAGGAITQAPAETPAWTALGQAQSDTTAFNGVSLATQVSPDATHLTGSSSWSGSHSWGTIGLEIAAQAGATFSGTGTASLTLTATETGTSVRSGSVTAPVSLTATETGASARSGAVTGALTLHATSTGVARRAGAVTAALALHATSTAASARSASVTAALHLTATAGSTVSHRSGTGTATISFTGNDGNAAPPFIPGSGGGGRARSRAHGESDEPHLPDFTATGSWMRTSPRDLELVRVVPWGYV